MKLNREQIIKALECCQTTSEMDCIDCPYRNKGNDLYAGCVNSLVVDALTLIKELTEESKKWEQAYDCMDSDCRELSSKCDELTEENERLRGDTVSKMHSEIEARCIKGGIYPAFVKSTIDQIAKEMLEGENEN